MRNRIVIVALAAVLSLAGRLAAQGHDDPSAAALRGLSAVWVVVEGVDPVVERAGLGREQLRIEITERLRAAGIRVVGRGAGMRDDTPFVYLRVQADETGRGDYAFIVEFELHEWVRVARDSSLLVVARTWYAPGAFGTVAPQEVATLRLWVDEFVDELIQEHRVAPGRGEPASSP